MQSAGFFVLIMEMLLFIAIAARCLWELIRTTPRCISLVRYLRERYRTSHGGRQQQPTMSQQESPEEGESMSGVGARRSVQTTLIPACLLKAALIIFSLFCESWVPYLVLPDLAYLATYGFLLIFLAEMQQIRMGATRQVWIKFAAWGLLAIVVLVSLIVCAFDWESELNSPRSLALRKFLYYELGITYLVMFVAFMYFGGRVCATAAHNRRIFYRVLLLTSVCGLAMSGKGCSLVMAAAKGWRTDTIFSTSGGRYQFEAFVALDELLPSIAIMMLTTKGRANRSEAEPSETTGFMRYGESPHLDSSPYSSLTPSQPIMPFPYGSGQSAV